MVTYDIVPTLTCSNSSLFVMSVPDLEQEREDRMYFRFLTPAERFMLVGHNPAHACRVSAQKATILTGNAFPVPMLSSVVGPLLGCLADSGVVAGRQVDSVLSPLQLRALSETAAIAPAIVEDTAGDSEGEEATPSSNSGTA